MKRYDSADGEVPNNYDLLFSEPFVSKRKIRLAVSFSSISLLPPQMRLGNSSRSPTIAGLVLEHLCPTIQNILEDGLRDHKLDLIIGQRRNHSWSVVEVSTRIGA